MVERTHPLDATSARLATIHRTQIQRDRWPEFEAFDRERYPLALRRSAAAQWWRRAREEYGSVHEFSALTHALTELRAPIELLGSLARILTDEARHADLCARTARAMLPEAELDDPSVFEWQRPRAPWPAAPAVAQGQDTEPLLAWCCDVILCASCIGETISRPLFEAVAEVCTDPLPEAVVRQILRDEHLHAAFGWEALAVLLPGLKTESRAWLEGRLAMRLRGFEKTCTSSVRLEDLVGREVVIARDPTTPNLGRLDAEQYATIFYATLESEVLPGFEALGFDAKGAWRTRNLPR